jgi:hypothetical protein
VLTGGVIIAFDENAKTQRAQGTRRQSVPSWRLRQDARRAGRIGQSDHKNRASFTVECLPFFLTFRPPVLACNGVFTPCCQGAVSPLSEPSVMQMHRRAVTNAGLSDLQFRGIRQAAINGAKRQGRNATEFAGHSDPKTTKHYLNEPVKVKPIRCRGVKTLLIKAPLSRGNAARILTPDAAYATEFAACFTISVS